MKASKKLGAIQLYPDGLTFDQYALLRMIQKGNTKHFEPADAAVLLEKGLAIITEPGDLSVTDKGLAVPRILKVSR